MRFEWDEAKNRSNIQKHGIDFNDATDLFKHPLLSLIDSRENYGEERWIGIGLLRHIIAVVVYTECDDVIRLISARKATKNEVHLYEQRIHHTD
ncbi:MAG: BrnT family toxin [Methylococcales bacterium]|nr:BrnT family toxin [Methylococcales bacterium]